MLREIFKFLDYFLPPGAWESKEAVLRARVGISFFSFNLLTLLLILLPIVGDKPDILMRLLLAAFNCSCLFLIKRSYPVGRLLLIYVFVTVLSFLALLVRFPGKIVEPLAYAYSTVMILLVLLFSNLKSRIFIVALIFTWSLLTWILAKDASIVVALGPTWIFNVIFPSIATIALIYVYLRLKAILQEELDREIEWQLHNARIAEISAMTRTMSSLMIKPLATVRRNLLETVDHPMAGNELENMESELKDLTEVSQSFGWIYRAYRDDGSYCASSETLLRHLRTLLSTRFESAGWRLIAKPIRENVELCGPIPSMMLLLFSKASQIVENSDNQDSRRLEMEISHDRGFITWTFSWPSEGREAREAVKERASANVDQTFVQDLSVACNAQIREFEGQGAYHLSISGAWCRALNGVKAAHMFSIT